ncbi:MAG: hypothetical protein N2483_06935, partial [Burkholderiaceae bacterium]|nr:hypothetical protein [Burkholderiaceae bacterium]
VLERVVSGNVKTLQDALDEDKEVKWQRALRDAAALFTLLTGWPLLAIARPAGYLAGVAQGRIEPTSELDLARGVITGAASPESKQ